MSPIQLCLVTPQQEFPNAHTITAILEGIRPKVTLAVLSGTCVANEGVAELGDVVVMTRNDRLAIVGELQHETELWRLVEAAGEGTPWYDESVIRIRPPQGSRTDEALILARLYAELNVSICILSVLINIGILLLPSSCVVTSSAPVQVVQTTPMG